MKFWVTLEGRDTEVEFRAERDRLVLEVEGRRIEADFLPLPDGEVYSLLVNGRSHEVRVAPAESGVEVAIHATTIPVEVRHPLEKLLLTTKAAHGRALGETVSAPMPGVVVALKVRTGDAVTAGQTVAVMEAMKMQNELAARGAGIVSEVLVSEKQSVAAGQPLVKLRPEPA
jgi:biotin carboxyl carrier protein